MVRKNFSQSGILAIIVIAFALFTIVGCQKEEIGKSINETQTTGVQQTNTLKAATVVPTGWSLVANTSKTGCKLYKKSTGAYYMQEIDLSLGAQIKVWAEPTVTCTTNVANTTLKWRPISSWWTLKSPSTSKLYSIANGTFFWLTYYNPAGSQAGDITFSSLPAKSSNVLYTCGSGSSQKQRVLSINWNGTQQVADILSFDAKSNWNYSNINTLLSSYATAIVGFNTDYDYGATSGTAGRTYIGVNGNKVYILTIETNITQATAKSQMTSWGVSSSKIMMLDGSQSTQLNCLGTNYISAGRKVPTIIGVLYN